MSHLNVWYFPREKSRRDVQDFLQNGRADPDPQGEKVKGITSYGMTTNFESSKSSLRRGHMGFLDSWLRQVHEEDLGTSSLGQQLIQFIKIEKWVSVSPNFILI